MWHVLRVFLSRLHRNLRWGSRKEAIETSCALLARLAVLVLRIGRGFVVLLSAGLGCYSNLPA